ncbi:7-carboxy-7-deazaguanine synthase QueE [Desulfurispira natronophila]|uniref:7-carboxy-7-deazaguanine synthase n=1 Tax=Desulfurispira natronophila TaxID=682562 RepID=A0A7W7Y3D5_9BACT|nr:organic radical activating enzyme [Desulfurispira natronophila]
MARPLQGVGRLMPGYVSEVFWSLQGEGPFCGIPQLFIRLHGCNLSCYYCDTANTWQDLPPSSFYALDCTQLNNPVGSSELFHRIILPSLSQVHSVCLTGGEPTEQGDFCATLLQLVRNHGCKTFLETNGTNPTWLQQHADLCSTVSADLKLDWASQHPAIAKQLLGWLQQRYLSGAPDYVKIICDDQYITELKLWLDVLVTMEVAFPVVLQPCTKSGVPVGVRAATELIRTYTQQSLNLRLIPQTHVLLEIP